MSKTTRRVRVAHGEQLDIVGELVFETDGRRETSLFRYAAEWLGNPQRFAIAPTMPLSGGPFHQSAFGGNRRTALPGPVSDGAPDAWGRGLIRKGWAGPLTELDYLLAADDATRQGALRYLDENGLPLACSEPPVPRLQDLEELRRLAQKADGDWELTPTERERLIGSVGSLGGARPKVNIRDQDGSLAIAKFTTERDSMPIERLEVATLELARRAGVNAATARLELGRTDRPVALLQRFDRAADGSRICYLSAQSFIGAQTATDAFYTDIADALRTHAFAPTAQLAELFRRILFTILVSNNDDHLKNHGLLLVSESSGSERAGGHRSPGRWALSPAFDINPQPQQHRQLETGISEHSGNAASVEAALEAAPFFGIHRDAATAMLAQMSAVVAAQWRPCCRRAGMTAAEIKRCVPAFEHEEHRIARHLTRGIGKA